MDMTVINKKIAVDELKIQDVTRSSLVLIGDADVITCSSIFNTPQDSLIRDTADQQVVPRQKSDARIQWNSDFFKEAQ
jgi:spore germination protein PD